MSEHNTKKTGRCPRASGRNQGRTERSCLKAGNDCEDHEQNKSNLYCEKKRRSWARNVNIEKPPSALFCRQRFYSVYAISTSDLMIWLFLRCAEQWACLPYLFSSSHRPGFRYSARCKRPYWAVKAPAPSEWWLLFLPRYAHPHASSYGIPW